MAKDTELTKKSAKSEKAAKPKQKKQNKVKKYFKDLKAEFKKVVWPSKKQVINNTSVVLVTMTFAGLFIWAFDMGLTKLIDVVLGIQ